MKPNSFKGTLLANRKPIVVTCSAALLTFASLQSVTAQTSAEEESVLDLILPVITSLNTPLAECLSPQSLAVINVTDNGGNDGNIPENTRDGDTGTRWSSDPNVIDTQSTITFSLEST